ncbi:tRNA (adenosine(37)-N6)-threonylcarbamoyltransferase complex transferase subunit TsaD [Candidatus Parcubacteria bacterium]|nr:tRNA (adenosine(37)-N6)-threonylcarbamoyltransferase complex transferase subunit TsaD [Candidatus Parcubacteria bacterium]
MKILGIETSCDETAVSVVNGEGENVEVLSNIVSSQVEIHKEYGGVVPEVAAREHVLSILPVVDDALVEAGINKRNTKKHIDAIAVTIGPGLITSLKIGIETAKVLSYAWNIPVVPINHIEGHIYANWISKKNETQNSNVKFPIIILTVSGGHTMIVLMRDYGDFEILGETRDDAAGEAFDKAAKMMDLGYPGGPIISANSEKLRETPDAFEIFQKENKLNFPRPMMYSKNYEFSFSGLKTAIRYQLEKDKDWKNKILEYCFEFQQAIIDVLIYKTIKAAKEYNVKTVMLAGGVSANKELRKQLEEVVKTKVSNVSFQIPDFKYTTDNAAMIASAGYFRARKEEFVDWRDLKVDCNLELGK